jgi:lipoprotein-anchoring transpeptidase ErfK/SrfK
MFQPVTVIGDGKTWILDPKGIVTIDVDAMVDAAYAPRQSATLPQRLSSQLTSAPLPADIKPVYSVNTSAIAQWVAMTATDVDRKPVDAKRKIVKYKFKIKKSVPGAQVQQSEAVTAIAQALSADAAIAAASRTVELPVKVRKPKVTEKDFKQAIIVSLSQCRIRLYQGTKLVKTYRCAPGRPAFPTPTGDFKINRKAAYAPWINPGSDWAKSMPKIIPGGPGNPMGTHKIGITHPGIFMHGVPPSEYSSIGTHASHGCMRMMPGDVLDLYGRVKVGSPVFIRP